MVVLLFVAVMDRVTVPWVGRDDAVVDEVDVGIVVGVRRVGAIPIENAVGFVVVLVLETLLLLIDDDDFIPLVVETTIEGFKGCEIVDDDLVVVVLGLLLFNIRDDEDVLAANVAGLADNAEFINEVA